MKLRYVGESTIIPYGTRMDISLKDFLGYENSKWNCDCSVLYDGRSVAVRCLDFALEDVTEVDEVDYLNELSKEIAKHKKFLCLSIDPAYADIPRSQDGFPAYLNLLGSWQFEGANPVYEEFDDERDMILHGLFHQMALKIAKEEKLDVYEIKLEYDELLSYGYYYRFYHHEKDGSFKKIADSPFLYSQDFCRKVKETIRKG